MTARTEAVRQRSSWRDTSEQGHLRPELLAKLPATRREPIEPQQKSASSTLDQRCWLATQHHHQQATAKHFN